MTIYDIGRQRLAAQSIAPATAETPAEVVRQLGAVQAQDYLGSLWAIGLRMKKSTETEVERAIADKQIVRTWPMRGTLHFVAPEDVRWLLPLLTPRVIAKSARRHQQLELDEATFKRGEALFQKALQGGKQLTRPEMMAVLAQGGISPQGQRGYHILCWTAQNASICFGPRQGKQDSFVWLDDWLPQSKTLSQEEALAELIHRYFTGHGPATIKDLMWWSGLKTAEVKAGLALVEDKLVKEEVEGQTYWFSPDLPTIKLASPSVRLLSSFDEYLLGYRERGAVLDSAYATKVVPGANGMFKPIIVVDGRVVGTWKRTLRKTKVLIRFEPFEAFSSAEREAMAEAAEPYGRFLGLPVEISA
jgi:hypothetical protein